MQRNVSSQKLEVTHTLRQFAYSEIKQTLVMQKSKHMDTTISHAPCPQFW